MDTLANNFNALGGCYADKGDYDLAIEYHQKTINIRKKIYGEKHSYVSRGIYNVCTCYQDKGDYTSALACFHDALIAAGYTFNEKSIFLNPSLEEYHSELWVILYNKTITFFLIYKHQNQSIKYLQASLSTIRLATDLVSDIRKSYKAESSKHYLANEAAKTYWQAIEIALQTAKTYKSLNEIPQHAEFENIPHTLKGAKNLAFDFTEQAKAALLLSDLKDNEARLSANIPNQLLEKEKQLKIDLNHLDTKITKLQTNNDKKSGEQLDKHQSQHFKLKQQYDTLIEELEKKHPDYHQLKYAVKTASIAEVQQYLTQKGKSVLLSHYLAENQIFIFAITPNDYKIAAIDKPENLNDTIEDLQTAISVGHPDLFVQNATKLFELLLQPVWNLIKNAQNLTIIPHNELYYIPFDVLINQHQMGNVAANDFANLPYLIRNYNISYHYSATLLLHCHKRHRQTDKKTDGFFGLAPVQFNNIGQTPQTQGYVIKNEATKSEKRTLVLKSSRSTAETLRDLNDTETEVKKVYQLFEKKTRKPLPFFTTKPTSKTCKSTLEITNISSFQPTVICKKREKTSFRAYTLHHR